MMGGSEKCQMMLFFYLNGPNLMFIKKILPLKMPKLYSTIFCLPVKICTSLMVSTEECIDMT